jgi:hypothetical protein
MQPCKFIEETVEQVEKRELVQACNTTAGDRPLGVESRSTSSHRAKAVARVTERAADKSSERSSKIEIVCTRRSQTRGTPRRTHHHGGHMKWKGSAAPHSEEDELTDKPPPHNAKERGQVRISPSPPWPARRGFKSPTPLRPPLSLAATVGQERRDRRAPQQCKGRHRWRPY